MRLNVATSVFIIAALSLAIPQAQASNNKLRFEALVGSCQYKAVGDGIWWNSKYPHALDMRDGCGLVAVSSVTPRANGLATGWRLAYTSLGKARVDAIFPIVDAEQALPAFDGLACDGATNSRCLARGRGTQSAEGLSLGYVIEDSMRGVALGLELGVFAYEGIWDISMSGEPRHHLGRDHLADFHFQGWQATPFIGATARYGYLFAMMRVYGRVRAAEHGCGGCSGVAGGYATQALLGLSVPF